MKLGLLTHEEAKTIFINIEELIPISEELLEKLKQMDISQPTTCPVGSIFLSMVRPTNHVFNIQYLSH